MNIQRLQELVRHLAGDRRGAHRPPELGPRIPQLTADLNRSKITIYPDEIEILTAICRIVDEEQSGDRAWQIVNDLALAGVYETPQELKHLHRAVAANIQESTTAYIWLSKREIASGVVVEIGGRHFVATTAHSVPAQPAGALSFVGDQPKAAKDNIPVVINFARDPEYRARDVAFIELEPEFTTRNLGVTPIPLSRVHPCGPGQKDYLTFLAGYPTAEMDLGQEVQGEIDINMCNLECWTSTLIMPDNWSVIEERHRLPDDQLDVFIPRPVGESVVSVGTTQGRQAGKLSEPFGLSGGGYWQVNDALRNGIWSAEHYSLIALQSHWWGKGRYLQGTQIAHWLRLLWSHQKELRTLLSDHFAQYQLFENGDSV